MDVPKSLLLSLVGEAALTLDEPAALALAAECGLAHSASGGGGGEDGPTSTTPGVSGVAVASWVAPPAGGAATAAAATAPHSLRVAVLAGSMAAAVRALEATAFFEGRRELAARCFALDAWERAVAGDCAGALSVATARLVPLLRGGDSGGGCGGGDDSAAAAAVRVIAEDAVAGLVAVSWGARLRRDPSSAATRIAVTARVAAARAALQQRLCEELLRDRGVHAQGRLALAVKDWLAAVEAAPGGIAGESAVASLLRAGLADGSG